MRHRELTRLIALVVALRQLYSVASSAAATSPHRMAEMIASCSRANSGVSATTLE